MMKGVSPVIAVVLLIAIAVIGAIAVWYWVAPLTGKPATISYVQNKFTVQRCYADTKVLDIRSESAFTTTDVNFSVINQDNGSLVCENGYNIASINPGETQQVQNSTACDVTTATPYILRSSQGIPDVSFTCS